MPLPLSLFAAHFILQERACGHVDGTGNFMASPQCLDQSSGKGVTKVMCFPPLEEILRLRKKKPKMCCNHPKN